MRPCKCRMIHGSPAAIRFKPCGIPLDSLLELNMTMDEFKAVRLADLLGMYQEEAAEKMKVSRQTFGNIVESVRKKIADVLVNGKALRIEGGEVKVMERHFTCSDCRNEWAVGFGVGRPEKCPKCSSTNFHRNSGERVCGKGFGAGRGQCHHGRGGKRQ